jgi:hypothetical protein
MLKSGGSLISRAAHKAHPIEAATFPLVLAVDRVTPSERGMKENE